MNTPMRAIVLAACLFGASLATADSATGVTVEPALRAQIARDGEASFWLMLRASADLRQAKSMRDWNARGEFVVSELQRVAAGSQAEVLALLAKRKIPHRGFWVVNAIHVTGGQAILDTLATRSEIDQIRAARSFTVPPPQTVDLLPLGAGGVEWNINRVRAPETWAAFGRGEGVVVANIDTGVRFTHPALVNTYRGNLGGGAFDHNYSWFDPSSVCGTPSLAPCDNNDHGTHTMGTMVGDDGGANVIGVAPGARWIAAKGCESNNCTDAALLASAEWLLAPTDLQGQNPRSDLRPHVVNNSWGGNAGDAWYMGAVDAWVAAGIFPQFAIGNSGSACGSAGSPGDYPQSYSAGGFDINDNVYGSGGRGPSAFGITKPDISAPAVSVRSSVSSGGYSAFTGTSMASPHVAGAVALLWSSAPQLIGDIQTTRDLLDLTAIDRGDGLTCGGDAADNNTWGQGMLDAFAAVEIAPRGPTGTLSGQITDAGTGVGLAGVSVTASGDFVRTAITDASGAYSFGGAVAVGSYDMTASLFGYGTDSANGVVVNEAATTIRNFALSAAPQFAVSGLVLDSEGAPVANATVTVLSTPLDAAVTDAGGFYQIDGVPQGVYDIQASAGGCTAKASAQATLDSNTTLDFELARRTDAFGYTCSIVSSLPIRGSTRLPLAGDDAALRFRIPFAFPFYGNTFSGLVISTNGYVNFLAGNSVYSNTSLPDPGTPNGAIYPFWDDLTIEQSGGVYAVGRPGSTGSDGILVLEWRNVNFYQASEQVTFLVVLFGDGRILMQYADLEPGNTREAGDSATIGIENTQGSDALQFAFDEAVLSSGLAILFSPPAP